MATYPVMQQPMPQRIGEVGGTREWSTGLLGCFSDFSSCIMTYFCLPCMECRNASRLGECCLLPHCCPGTNIAMRARLRTLGGIRGWSPGFNDLTEIDLMQGSILCDICALSCCYMCAVCQMSREMDNMGI